MTVLGQQQKHAMTRMFELLAETVPQIPGATERQILWFRGFYRWWLHSGHLGELADPVVRGRREVQARLTAMLEALRNA